MASKTKKIPFLTITTIAGLKLTYVGKVPKILFENLRENRSILEHISLEKYLKAVLSTVIVWKMIILEIKKIMKIKKGSNKKIVFSRPLEKYVLDK